MTEYADVPLVNQLYVENQNVQNGIDLLNAGGTMSSFTLVAPSNPPPGSPLMMGATIQVTGPMSPELTAALVATLEAKQMQIMEQLAALGVTDPPPAKHVVKQ